MVEVVKVLLSYVAALLLEETKRGIELLFGESVIKGAKCHENLLASEVRVSLVVLIIHFRFAAHLECFHGHA